MSRLSGSLDRFAVDDRGAVTIDWVALTAAGLLLGIMVTFAIFNRGVDSVVDDINATLRSVGSSISADYAANSVADDSGSGPVATGSASQRACEKTLKYVVCVGTK